MRFTRTVVTACGLALAGVSALTGTGEVQAGAGPAPAGGAPPTARPATYLAIRAGGWGGSAHQVVEVEVAGDGPERVRASVPEGEIVDVERGPDGTGYYAFVIGDTIEIRRLGTDEVVAPGWAPAVSPDGRRLAYAYLLEDAGMCAGDGVAVLELATGEVRRFPGPNPDPGPDGCPDGDGIIGGISWAPDSRRLAFESLKAMGGPFTVRLLDTAGARDLAAAEPLDSRRQYSHPAWLADGRIAVAEPDAGTGTRIMAVDPDTRAARQFAPTAWQSPDVNGVDADASGRHLLVAVDGGHSNRLFMLSEGAPAEELAGHSDVAVW